MCAALSVHCVGYIRLKKPEWTLCVCYAVSTKVKSVYYSHTIICFEIKLKIALS